jgi:hypothetical protein
MENKNILLCAMEFASLTGAPMYNYNLAKGLIELGHDVTCVGLDIGGHMMTMLENIGCKVYKSIESPKWEKYYDLAIISENFPQYLDFIYADKVYNFCHSKHIIDQPIDDNRITGYLAPREQIANKWNKEFTIIPIPIDFDRFTPKTEKQESYTILAPCTRDLLRRPMFISLIERAKKDPDIEVWLVGEDHNGIDGLELPENIKVMPSTNSIEVEIAKADEIAGIFIGTVTLEAWAMNKKTSVYDDEGNWEYVEKPDDFEKHNYKNVAKQILKL